MTQIVTLITDFGFKDSYVAEMKAVILSSSRDVRLVDLCHEVTPFDIEWGAFQLLRSYSYFPTDSWHLAVIDPGVGTPRRSIYVKVGQTHFVGPDNGLLQWAVRDAERRYGFSAEIFEIPQPPGLAPTFHGRDVFAPLISAGMREKLPQMKVLTTLEGRDFPAARELNGVQRGEVLGPDHFGNIISSVPFSEHPKVEAELGDRVEKYQVANNYLSIEEEKVAIIKGSHGFWEFACRKGSAWEQLNVRKGEAVTVYPLS